MKDIVKNQEKKSNLDTVTLAYMIQMKEKVKWGAKYNDRINKTNK